MENENSLWRSERPVALGNPYVEVKRTLVVTSRYPVDQVKEQLGIATPEDALAYYTTLEEPEVIEEIVQYIEMVGDSKSTTLTVKVEPNIYFPWWYENEATTEE